MATLGQTWLHLAQGQVCQVDLAESYEHKHQGLSQEDPHKGLLRMTTDITLCLLGQLTQAGAQVSLGLARSLQAAYAPWPASSRTPTPPRRPSTAWYMIGCRRTKPCRPLPRACSEA